jgi:hypothetical protein
VLLEVILHGGYNSFRKSRSAIIRPPAHTARRTRASPVVRVCSSARNRCTQRSQFTRIPRNPSQTPTEVAAYEITLGAKLWSSTP